MTTSEEIKHGMHLQEDKEVVHTKEEESGAVIHQEEVAQDLIITSQTIHKMTTITILIIKLPIEGTRKPLELPN